MFSDTLLGHTSGTGWGWAKSFFVCFVEKALQTLQRATEPHPSTQTWKELGPACLLIPLLSTARLKRFILPFSDGNPKARGPM